ncbi:MerR family transcriptional regulator [Phenylobacterium sp.]|uniref:MerR family transcriptional regulator n=1 Tax=Phenylobacterium sp. TaxID=1871053 RepID=UPI0035B35066
MTSLSEDAGFRRLRLVPRKGSYASLGAAMREFGLTARALRYYEEVGLIEADRDRLNCRRYDERAMDRLRLIAQFRRAGLDVRDIRLILERREQGDASEGYVDCAVARLQERLAVIESERQQLEEALGLLQAGRQDRAAPAAADTPRSAAAILRQSRPGRQPVAAAR